MKQTVFVDFTGKVNRKDPHSKVGVWRRENLLSRNKRLKTVPGFTKASTNTMTGIPTWMGRYYTLETGSFSPKTFCYTQDGKIWRYNERDTVTVAVDAPSLQTNAYPKHAMFKSTEQTFIYLVDGQQMYKYDGNNHDTWEKVTLLDTVGGTLNPIDIIEHRDRIWLLSKTSLYVSKNLEPEVFDDATDCLNIIVGSGRGQNMGFAKVGDRLFIFTTEGIFAVIGDTISAQAATFDIVLVDDGHRASSSRSIVKVEKGVIFLGDDLELWSFDGSSCKLLSYEENLKTLFFPAKDMLAKAVATYEDNYYKLSFVKTGDATNNMEVWYDALEDKIDFIVGRGVTCYLRVDTAEEQSYEQFGSNTKYLMYGNQKTTFDGTAIVQKLNTGDIVMSPGRNVRIKAFYPKFEPTGSFHCLIRYHLDGRISPITGSSSFFEQDLRGEGYTLGTIHINNQWQVTDRVIPQMRYCKGESISFEINENAVDLQLILIGMGIEFIGKSMKKREHIGV